MNSPTKNSASFSPGQRWKIALDVLLRTLLLLAVVGMLNFLGARFHHRLYLSSQTNVTLHPPTLAVLRTVTNQFTVTLYYDTHDPGNFYQTIVALLNEYHAANQKISVRTVDYLHNPGEAEKIKEQYHLPGSTDSPNAPPSKDLIIFDNGKRSITIPGDSIVRYKITRAPVEDPNQKDLELRRKPVAFNGEVMFTSKILALTSEQPFKACFLQGDGESSLSQTDDYGFAKFGLALAQNYISVQNLELTGDHFVPADCSLLIIAAPSALSESAVQKIDKYLMEGGRLLALLNFASVNRPTGLEPILKKWGVNVMPDFVKDRDNSAESVIVRKFAGHPVVNALSQLKLQMVRPRCIAKLEWAKPPANAPQVDELAFSSENSILVGDPAAPPRSFPLIVAIEQKPVAGVANPRGNTRMIIAGDSLFLGNTVIEAGGNRDFVSYAANWLLDREQLIAGIGPRSVTEFRLVLSDFEQRELSWLLLGALPGTVLMVGWLVWLVRRK